MEVRLVVLFYLHSFLLYNLATIMLYSVELPRYVLTLWNIGVVKLLHLTLTICPGEIENTKQILAYISMMTYFGLGLYLFISKGEVHVVHLFMTVQQAGVFLFSSFFLENLTDCPCASPASKSKTFPQKLMLCDCSICLDTSVRMTTILPCKHTFHVKCIDPWFARNKELSCPLCRRVVT